MREVSVETNHVSPDVLKYILYTPAELFLSQLDPPKKRKTCFSEIAFSRFYLIGDHNHNPCLADVPFVPPLTITRLRLLF